jgi:hypothetical protein
MADAAMQNDLQLGRRHNGLKDLVVDSEEIRAVRKGSMYLGVLSGPRFEFAGGHSHVIANRLPSMSLRACELGGERYSITDWAEIRRRRFRSSRAPIQRRRMARSPKAISRRRW